MAAEALIVEDAYKRGYTDAMADMRKKKEQRRQRCIKETGVIQCRFINRRAIAYQYQYLRAYLERYY